MLEQFFRHTSYLVVFLLFDVIAGLNQVFLTLATFQKVSGELVLRL